TEATTVYLHTKVYIKETDTHALLHQSSFHPKHTFRGIVMSQLIRFYRLCTQQRDFNTATGTLFEALRRRGYSKRSLRYIKADMLASITENQLPLPPNANLNPRDPAPDPDPNPNPNPNLNPQNPTSPRTPTPISATGPEPQREEPKPEGPSRSCKILQQALSLYPGNTITIDN
ncbi:unnamed protein product, partial [Coregonus sp. 'balchen']